MLDIDLLRNRPDWVKEQLARLHDPSTSPRIDRILALDAQRRELITRAQTLKEARNTFSKGTGKLRGDKGLAEATKLAAAQAIREALEAGEVAQAIHYLQNPADAPASTEADLGAAFDQLFAQLKQFNEQISAIDEDLRTLEAELHEEMLWLPNLPHESVPVAASEAENIAHPVQGEMRHFDFTPLPHWELGPMLGIIDFERGVKLSGSRFYILRHKGAGLYRALINWMLDEHISAGYEESYVPFMVREHAMFGSSQFPKFRDVVYLDSESELYMLPTAEVALTNMYADEVLDEADLPLKFVAHTPCFRREKMSAGRDVRGLKRVHQFEKVELYKFTTPESSYAALEAMMQQVEAVAAKLKIPYRRLEIVTGDLGFSATRKFDIEMYAPGCEEWLEVSSCSNTESFQARRANIRYRPTDGGKPQYVHTLNGSGMGMIRVLIAIMEHYQQADHSILIPEVLRPYLGGLESISPQ